MEVERDRWSTVEVNKLSSFCFLTTFQNIEVSVLRVEVERPPRVPSVRACG